MFLIEVHQKGFKKELLGKHCTVEGYETKEEAIEAMEEFKKSEVELFGGSVTSFNVVEV